MATTFPDPTKSLQMMRLSHEIEDALIGESNNMLADCIRLACWQHKPVKQLLAFVSDCYADNPKAVVSLLGIDLTKRILSTLCSK